MDDNKVLKIIYTFFLGILLAIFVGVGINTFYEAPKYPEYPVETSTYKNEPTPQQEAKQEEFNKQLKRHDKDIRPYNRNVSMLTLGAAVIFLVLSSVFEKRTKIIADGVMLGGLFTLLYSIGRGFASENSNHIFIVVSVGLAVVLYLGYHRFTQSHQPPTKTAKK